MHVVDTGVLSLPVLLLRYPPEVQYLHVDVRRDHPECERMDLHEGLLEQIGEKIPVLLCEGTGAEAPLDTGAIDEEAANDDGCGGEEVPSPLALLVNHDEKGHQE